MAKILLLIVAALITWAPVVSRAQGIGSYDQLHYSTPAQHSGEWLVDFENTQDTSTIRSLLQSIGMKSGSYSWFSKDEKWVRVSGIAAAIVQRLRGSKSVEGIEPNYYMSALAVPNDPYYKHQWHLDLIGMKQAWDYPAGGEVIVAVIDTGIAYEKFQQKFRVEDLGESQFVKPYNFVKGNEHANDDHGHGTHVAGTIAQLTNNNIGVAGVAPRVKLMPLKVLNSYGYGTISDIAAAIRYAADNGAKVINMSLGGPFPSFILHKAIRYAHNKGVTIVCAAGNSGRSGLSYPAKYSECVSVSAVRFDGTRSWYSSYGKGLTIAAPGGDMNVDQNGDGLVDGVLQNTLHPQDRSRQGYFLFQGTSMAAPHVAATAALLISHGISDPEKVRKYLQNTATPPKSRNAEEYGTGIVNAHRALLSAFFYRRIRLLVFAVTLLVLLVKALNRGRMEVEKVKFGATALLGALIGATGLFFLSLIPGVGNHFFVTHALPEWQLKFFGADDYANPIFFSFLPVLAFTLLLYAFKPAIPFLVGMSAGTAAFLLYQIFSPVTGIAWVPSSLLESAWLALNALLCLFLSFMQASRLR